MHFQIDPSFLTSVHPDGMSAAYAHGGSSAGGPSPAEAILRDFVAAVSERPLLTVAGNRLLASATLPEEMDLGTRLAARAGISLSHPHDPNLSGKSGNPIASASIRDISDSGVFKVPASRGRVVDQQADCLNAPSTSMRAGREAKQTSSQQIGSPRRAASSSAISSGSMKRGRGGVNGSHRFCGGGVSSMSMMQWLGRADRVVNPKESFWIFCEVRGMKNDHIAP